jgi:Zn finger protein HypA/HybF involved in hydrogenase expression
MQTNAIEVVVEGKCEECEQVFGVDGLLYGGQCPKCGEEFDLEEHEWRALLGDFLEKAVKQGGT